MQPVRGAGAHVGQRLEVQRQRGLGGLQRGLKPRLALQRGFGLGGAAHGGGHAAERKAGGGDAAVFHFQRQRGADGRDVAVEALADLVRPHLLLGAAARHFQRMHKLAGLQLVFHVVGVEIF